MEVRLAETHELKRIVDLYKLRIKWFKENQINQWSGYFERYNLVSDFKDYIKESSLYVITNNDEMVAAFRLSYDGGTAWPFEAKKALYIKCLVTNPNYKNVGSFIFDSIKEIAISKNINLLRLDCIEKNNKLNQIYKKHGFKLIEKNIDYKYPYDCSLYELILQE